MLVTITQFRQLATDEQGNVLLGMGKDRTACQALTAAGSFTALDADTAFVRLCTDTQIQLDIDGGAVTTADELFMPGEYMFSVNGGETLSFIASWPSSYETVAASSTNQALGATGAIGDYLDHIVIQPATTAAGTVTVKDNATTVFTFTTGTLADLKPIHVPIRAVSVSGAWNVTTGLNVTVLGVGRFT